MQNPNERTVIIGIAVFLAIEFLDEFVYGLREAALPLMRDELRLSYSQVGLLLGVPSLVSSVLEPLIGIWADTGEAAKRTRKLILWGWYRIALSLALNAVSQRFAWLLLSYAIFYPASGAFVSLSQSQLMLLHPVNQEQNMARWTLQAVLGYCWERYRSLLHPTLE